MLKKLKIILGIVFLLATVGFAVWYYYLRPAPLLISETDRTQLNIMPLPYSIDLGSDPFVLSDEISINLSGVTSDRVNRAADRFGTRIKTLTGTSIAQSATTGISITTQTKANPYPSLNEDESYEISISNDKIILKAQTERGTLHGLESLLQLLQQDDAVWYWPEISLKDNPRYPYRGLMIDVSRHWIPKDVILRNIDGMTAVKLNVLHLHLSDHQAFRIESKSYPKLHEQGSKGNYYTQEDIKEIIDYAADRGVQIIPEFDVPGHSTSWLVGYPALASAPGPYTLQKFMPLGNPVFDPSNEYVYEFLDTFFSEMAELFPSEYLHIGGDEASRLHWKESDRIQAYMEENEIADHDALQAYFNQRLYTIIKSKGKKMIGWDEILHPDLPHGDITVQSWRGHKTLWEGARSGYEGILSAGYYLDHNLSSEKHYSVDPDVIKGGVKIDTDTANWQSWACDLDINDMELMGNLYLFGAGENLRGIVQIDENVYSFTDVEESPDGSLKFKHETPYGTLKYNLKLYEGTVKGEAKISIFTIKINGQKSGGSGLADGIPLPKFEKIEPLTDDQMNNILGGEACMWSEFVNEITVDSRIWPRAAAVAEKLWSPQSLTTDIDDMYRRLMHTDLYLEHLGLLHNQNSTMLTRDMISASHAQAFSELVEILQEDKLFNRMQIYESGFTTETPLDRVVDAASPESYTAYRFSKDVDLYTESGDLDAKERVLSLLDLWSQNYDQLSQAFVENEAIREVEQHSIHLSQLSAICLKIMRESESRAAQDHKELLSNASVAYGGTIMPLVDGFRKIIESDQ